MNPTSTDLDPRYGAPDVDPTAWEQALEVLRTAELSWASTVRPDGTPHVTPLITVLHDGLLHFATGPEERKARNLAANPAVTLTTGTNTLHEGLDIVLEGTVERVTGRERIAALAEAWVEKYTEEWRFEVGQDGFVHPGGHGDAWVFAVRPRRAYGFGKNPPSHTRWTF